MGRGGDGGGGGGGNTNAGHSCRSSRGPFPRGEISPLVKAPGFYFPISPISMIGQRILDLLECDLLGLEDFWVMGWSFFGFLGGGVRVVYQMEAPGLLVPGSGSRMRRTTFGRDRIWKMGRNYI